NKQLTKMHPWSIALIFAFTGNAIASAIRNDVESVKTDSNLVARFENCWWDDGTCWCEDFGMGPSIYDDEHCMGIAKH
ncbi:hypothetical protein Cpir12675_006992, partial [Ceratocystis pirilliformis]